MLPNNTAHNKSYQRLVNAVFLAQPFLTCATSIVATAYLYHAFISQFRHAATLAARWILAPYTLALSLATLTIAVCHVVGVSTQKQMVGPHAQAVRPIAGRVIPVAIVTNIHSLWNRPIGQFIRHAMSVSALPVDKCSGIASGSETAPCPNPASLRFINIFPETLLNGDGFEFSIGVHVVTSNQVSVCHEVGRHQRRGLILFAQIVPLNA